MLWGMPLTKDIRLVCPHCGKYLARKYGDARFVAMIAAAPFSRVVFDYPVFSVKWNIHLVMVVVLVGMAALDMLANKAFVLSKKNADSPVKPVE